MEAVTRCSLLVDSHFKKSERMEHEVYNIEMKSIIQVACHAGLVFFVVRFSGNVEGQGPCLSCPVINYLYNVVSLYMYGTSGWIDATADSAHTV